MPRSRLVHVQGQQKSDAREDAKGPKRLRHNPEGAGWSRLDCWGTAAAAPKDGLQCSILAIGRTRERNRQGSWAISNRHGPVHSETALGLADRMFGAGQIKARRPGGQ